MPADKFSIRRILVALDASPQSLAALRAAVELAVKLEAQVLGLFVEDVDLLRLAGSPFARELLLPTAKEMPLDRSGMERKLKAQAEQARKALAMAADPAKVEWTFRVVRGRVPSEILAAASECDLLALGWRGWSLIKKSGMGSTASAAVSEAVSALLLSERGVISDLPIIVCFDGTAAARRGVLAAAELAQLGSQKLTVILLSGPKPEEHLRREMVELLAGKDIQWRCASADILDKARLYRVIRSELPGLLVLTGKEPFPKPDPIAVLLDEINFSVLLLGEDSWPEG